ncbi:hypothetical protein ACP70R_007452 [Stipagrostis hirtigluma subsp. patula]
MSVVLGGRTHKRSRFEFHAGVSSWTVLPADILGLVLRFLSCLADRASVRSVCRHWRAAARGHVLPLPKFRFSCLSPEGALRAPRPFQMPDEVGTAADFRCVDSCDGWLVAVTPNKDYRVFDRDVDGEGFLVNAFSHEVVPLPRMCNSQYNSAYSFKTLPVINSSGVINFNINDMYTMSLRKMVLSASPNSGSKYIVAASSDMMVSAELALWQPGMESWHFCNGTDTDGPKDITFYQGKLYVLRRFIPRLLAFVLEEDDRGIIVSRVEHCVTEPLPPHPVEQDGSLSSNMVVCRGKLLLIIRYYDSCYRSRRSVIKVKVFALDFSTNPCGLTEIHSFDGDCIFVGSGSCKSVPTGLHDGVEGDLIYFVPDFWSPYDRFVYSMRDGRMKPFAVRLLPSKVPDNYLDFPVWLCPSE